MLMASGVGGGECWFDRGFIREFLHGFNREFME